MRRNINVHHDIFDVINAKRKPGESWDSFLRRLFNVPERVPLKRGFPAGKKRRGFRGKMVA